MVSWSLVGKLGLGPYSSSKNLFETLFLMLTFLSSTFLTLHFGIFPMPDSLNYVSPMLLLCASNPAWNANIGHGYPVPCIYSRLSFIFLVYFSVFIFFLANFNLI